MKIILHGLGHMGRAVMDIVEKNPDAEIVCGVDKMAEDFDFPVYKNINEVKETADVVIDFSTAAAVDGLLSWCAGKKMPVVLCTTGLSDDQIELVNKTAEKTAVLRSANMSLGINTIINMLKSVSPVFLNAGFDAEIVEKHHNRKLDAPSGTAEALADAVNESMDGKYHYVYDRHERREKRDPYEIGISSVRAGTLPGEHEVIFAGNDEVIEIKHTSYSRNIFASGAVSAARFLMNKPAGLYGMDDVISGN